MADASTFRSLVAFLYQRSGRQVMSENELANAASLDLKWFAPKAARELVAGLVRAGWLERDEDGDLVPSFDVKEVKVSIGFRPPQDLSRDVPPPGTYHAKAREEPAPETSAVAEATPPKPVPVPPPVAAEPEEADAPATLLGRLLERLSEMSGEERAHWVSRMDAVVQRTQDAVTPEVALLIAAAKQGLEVTEWLEEARTSGAASS